MISNELTVVIAAKEWEAGRATRVLRYVGIMDGSVMINKPLKDFITLEERGRFLELVWNYFLAQEGWTQERKITIFNFVRDYLAIDCTVEERRRFLNGLRKTSPDKYNFATSIESTLRAYHDKFIAPNINIKPSPAFRESKCRSNAADDDLRGTPPAREIGYTDQMRKDFQDPQRPIRIQTDVRSMVKIGPWGGTGGTPRDIRVGTRPRYLETIKVCSTDIYGGRIYGFFFVYNDCRGQSIPVGFWGSSYKGYQDTITMGYGEHVNYVSGTTDNTGVRSLMFGTNKGIQRTYGYPSGKTFSVPMQQEGGEVIGFFGRADACLVALGAYIAQPDSIF